MFDVSWGEIAVVTGGLLVLVGRRDLPLASRAIGSQLGRIVGLMQGARIRADRFASDHQLRALQNEFRSGLRELDAVKAELAGSMVGRQRGIRGLGGGLGATVPGVDRKPAGATGQAGAMGAMGAAAGAAQALSAPAIGTGGDPSAAPSPPSMDMGAEYLAAAQQAETSEGANSPPIMTDVGAHAILAPRSRSVAAVAEEEWEKRGIGFRSIAEGGASHQQLQQHTHHDPNAPYSPPVTSAGGAGGAAILSNYLRQSLIYDQYERTVREQDEALRSRVEKVRNEREEASAAADSSKRD